MKQSFPSHLLNGGCASGSAGTGTVELVPAGRLVYITGVWFSAGGNGNGMTLRDRLGTGTPWRVEGPVASDICNPKFARPIGPFNGLEAVFGGTSNPYCVSWVVA